MAYFLVSDQGSDPVISDVLGLKREQIEGVRNPGEHLIERRHLGENQLRMLATAFLKSRGIKLPTHDNVVSIQSKQGELLGV